MRSWFSPDSHLRNFAFQVMRFFGGGRGGKGVEEMWKREGKRIKVFNQKKKKKKKKKQLSGLVRRPPLYPHSNNSLLIFELIDEYNWGTRAGF